MKKIILPAILTLFCLACTKNKGNSDDPYTAKISFTYNGNQYNISSSGSYIKEQFLILLSADFAGLHIKGPDIFGGTIDMDCNPQGNIACTLFIPSGMNALGSCSNFNNNGAPIDSVKVYWYESGSVNFFYTDCKNNSNGPSDVKDCAINGTFSLTLTNKNNQKIILSNGSFSGRIKKYR